jgi:oligopeptide/dipeptide ABC transporter ATP-binding protein
MTAEPTVAQLPLIEGRSLTKTFGGGRKGTVHALENVNIAVAPGETLGLVGESGCGKTTLARCLVRLEDPTSGSVIFDDNDITTVHGAALRKLRRDFQIVFQDPSGSLDPRMPVGKLLTEGMRAHGIGTNTKDRRERVERMLAEVGLNADAVDRYPTDFSGGQQQRIGIARALLLEPRLLVADEPVASLDVSVQAQILNLLVRMKERYGLTMLFVAHDLSVVAYISDRIAVMYLGKIVELGTVERIIERPQHPYTVGLLASIPGTQDRDAAPHLVPGDLPSPHNPPSGCRFHPRCPIRQDICSQIEPPLVDDGFGGQVACHFAGQLIAPTLPSVLRSPTPQHSSTPEHPPTPQPAEH